MRIRLILLGCILISAIGLGTSALLKLWDDSHRVEEAPHLSKTIETSNQDICGDVYQAICKRKGETRDPTGDVNPDAVGELQAMKIYENVIQEHPNWSKDQVQEELANRIYTPRRRSRLESAFKWVKDAVRRFIDEQPSTTFTRLEKTQILRRLDRVELQLPPPASVYNDEPDLFTKNEVYYERTIDGKLRMRVGGAYLFTAKSWFNIIFTVAHELGHSIDPCEIRVARLSFPAYDRLSACFVRQRIVSMRRTRSECGKNDQLSEAFADWLAVHITAMALKSFAREFPGTQLINAVVNSVRDLCEQDEVENELDFEYHPTPEVRIDGIFGRNPEIREILGCPVAPQKTPLYCDFERTL